MWSIWEQISLPWQCLTLILSIPPSLPLSIPLSFPLSIPPFPTSVSPSYLLYTAISPTSSPGNGSGASIGESVHGITVLLTCITSQFTTRHDSYSAMIMLLLIVWLQTTLLFMHDTCQIKLTAYEYSFNSSLILYCDIIHKGYATLKFLTDMIT